MARVWLDGFEINSTTNAVVWDGYVGTVSNVTTPVNSPGSQRSLRCNPSAATGYVKSKIHDTTETSVYYARFYIRVATLPAGDTTIFKFCTTGGTAGQVLKITSTGTLKLYHGSTQVGSTSGSALSTNTWYRINLKIGYGISLANYVKVDGSSWISGTVKQTQTCNEMRVGVQDTETCDIYFDDVTVDDSADPGASSIVALFPNAAGDLAQWTPSAGSNYDCVDENPPATADYVSIGSDAQKDLYNIQALSDLSLTLTTPVVFCVGMYAKCSSTSYGWYALCKEGGSTSTSSTFHQPDANNTYCTFPITSGKHPRYLLMLTTPPSSAAWTDAVIAATQIGIESQLAGVNTTTAAGVWAMIEGVFANSATTSSSTTTTTTTTSSSTTTSTTTTSSSTTTTTTTTSSSTTTSTTTTSSSTSSSTTTTSSSTTTTTTTTSSSTSTSTTTTSSSTSTSSTTTSSSTTTTTTSSSTSSSTTTTSSSTSSSTTTTSSSTSSSTTTTSSSTSTTTTSSSTTTTTTTTSSSTSTSTTTTSSSTTTTTTTTTTSSSTSSSTTTTSSSTSTTTTSSSTSSTTTTTTSSSTSSSTTTTSSSTTSSTTTTSSSTSSTTSTTTTSSSTSSTTTTTSSSTSSTTSSTTTSSSTSSSTTTTSSSTSTTTTSSSTTTSTTTTSSSTSTSSTTTTTTTSSSTTTTTTSSSTTTSTTTTISPTSGGLAFGEQNPTQGETASSWQTFSNGSAVVPTVIGDADWGKIELDASEEGRSQVYDFGSISSRTITVTENRYGTGQGTATIQIRGQDTIFLQDDGEPPVWENYVAPIEKTWRFIQLRVIKI